MNTSARNYVQSLVGFKTRLPIPFFILHVIYSVQLASVSWFTLTLGGLIHSRGLFLSTPITPFRAQSAIHQMPLC